MDTIAEQPPQSGHKRPARAPRGKKASGPRLLVGDSGATRLGVRMALEGLVEICAEVEDATLVIRAAKEHQPEVCLIGPGLAGDCMAAIRGVCRAAPAAKVIFMAPPGANPDDMLDAVRSGAVGYIPASINVEALRRIIKAAVADEAIMPRTMILDLVREVRAAHDDSNALTRRETQILGMVRRGHSTAMIAERLDLSAVTVRRHISAIVQKLGVEDRSVLVDAVAPTR